jgi:putative transposase
VKPTRLISPPGTYFVTFIAWQGRRSFVVEPYARLFLRILYGYRRQGKFRLHAFVLMPEHVHLLLTPADDVTLERAVQLIKGGFSHAFGLEYRRGEVWQRGFSDHRIRDKEDFDRHLEYIHQNPVKRRLVERASEYRYCSAFPGLKLDKRPQRLKPPSSSALAARLKSCPSRFAKVLHG